MTDRPAFDPTVYESLELGELNRPLHDLFWNMYEVELELNRARDARVSNDVYAPIEARYFAARDLYNAGRDQLDAEVAAYCDRVEAAGGLDAYLGRVEPAEAADDRQLALVL